ncbi:MAG: hypothetical protein DRP89_07315 [Candidatus Neomarinimicrobiota bacterium]|nr:MAG: hypothetical protein DRP89_07315 [Candidatus Neomarinimicrobiota bacterium]
MKITNKILLITLIVILVFVAVIIIASRVIVDKSFQDEYSGIETLNKELITKYFDVTGFTGLSASGSWQITVNRGVSYQVRIEAPEYLMDDVVVRKIGKILNIGLEWKTRIHKRSLKAEITMPNLDRIKSSDGSKIRFDDFDTDNLEIRVSGASGIKGINNTISNLYINSSGATHINLKRSSVINADLHTSGVSSIELTMAGGELTGSASGAGSITYYGNVEEQSLRTSGAVSVRKR